LYATDAAPLSQVPVENITLAGQYTAIANCAYQRLDKASGNGIKKIDLANETRLALESGGVRYWELTFTPAGKQPPSHSRKRKPCGDHSARKK